MKSKKKVKLRGALTSARGRKRHTSAALARKQATLANLQTTFGKWLYLADDALLPVTMGTLLAHYLGGDPVWLLLVAVPSGCKTETIRALEQAPSVFELSDLTGRTLVSGAQKGQAALLNRLQYEILTFKEFTTILQAPHETRRAVFAQLREIYDGSFKKEFGHGDEPLKWKGRLGFIAGVTPVIDQHMTVMSILGARFVMLRINVGDRAKLAAAAAKGHGQEEVMRKELRDAVERFIRHRYQAKPPKLPHPIRQRLERIADFTTRARSGVVREGRRFAYAMEPEAPGRLAKVFCGLARGIALAYDRRLVTNADLKHVCRVALDSLPEIRRHVLNTLLDGTLELEEGADAFPVAHVAGMTRYSLDYVWNTLVDLRALGVVTSQQTKHRGHSTLWSIRPEWARVFRQLLGRKPQAPKRKAA